MNQIIGHAQQTFLAMKDPYRLVEKVYSQTIHAVEKCEDIHYVGIKNAVQIPLSLIKKLKNYGYELHTIDRCSINGGAIDMQLRNPITGSRMTGFSSGTAINVFLGINNLGIGTDGGGSVLAPTMSVQYYGFISPLIEHEHMKQYEKYSTDGLCFTPFLGLISRGLGLIKEAAAICLDLQSGEKVVNVFCPESLKENIKLLTQRNRKVEINVDSIRFSEFDNRRSPMIDFLRQNLPDCNVLVSYEKKIDVNGLGDSVFGHLDRETQAVQLKSGKFLIRVANMVGATALYIPDTAPASGYVLMYETEVEKTEKMFQVVEEFPKSEDELIERYFRNADAYFTYDALEEGLIGYK